LHQVALAQELQRATGKFQTRRGAKLWLRAGLDCGPVAGAVIGNVRAFYCLYGDTVWLGLSVGGITCSMSESRRAQSICQNAISGPIFEIAEYSDGSDWDCIASDWQVNTAARMCKYAVAGGVHATARAASAAGIGSPTCSIEAVALGKIQVTLMV
jgi:hypothetical protein